MNIKNISTVQYSKISPLVTKKHNTINKISSYIYLYIYIYICCGKYFCTDCEKRRKLCIAANGAISNKFALSEKFYMHILRSQCIPILTYGVGVWKCKNEQLRKLDVQHLIML